MRLPGDWVVILTSLSIHILLILYAHHVDTHPEQFGGLKYTDVDWRVVTDGAKLIFNAKEGQARAQGWIVRALGLSIGDPYQRQTFRYSPLLPLVLSPTLIHPLFGKLTLSLLSLLVPVVLLCQSRPPKRALVHALWTLNPLVINITTRGSPEAIILLLVIGTLVSLRRASEPKAKPGHQIYWESIAALMYSASISWKIYPIIYAPAIWAHLACIHGWFGWNVWRFGLVTVIGLISINLPLWSIWGQPFLDQTFLYHLSRQDHRHNFSAYYYPIYLSFFGPSLSEPTTWPQQILHTIQQLGRNSLASFIPQFGLVALVGLYLTPRTSLEFGMFLQTVIFVVFNKVCTSQYFIWFIPLLPDIIPNLYLSTTQTIVLISAWVGAQALWLGTAYQLEFLARSVHLQLWACGVLLFGISVWIIGRLIDAWDDRRVGHSDSGVAQRGRRGAKGSGTGRSRIDG